MKKDSWNAAFRIMANISGWIAFPVIIGLFFGGWLDKKFNTAPWLLVTTIGLAFFISMYGLVTSALKEFKKMERDARQNKKSDLIDK